MNYFEYIDEYPNGFPHAILIRCGICRKYVKIAVSGYKLDVEEARKIAHEYHFEVQHGLVT